MDSYWAFRGTKYFFIFKFSCSFQYKIDSEKIDLDMSESEIEDYNDEMSNNEETTDSDISDLEIEEYSDEESDNENQNVMLESVSETEDNLEIVSEEESDHDEYSIDSMYTAKSGLQWSNKPFTRSRRRQRNICNIRPGMTQYSKDSHTILDIFNLFLTAEMKDICLHTNEEASRYYDD